MCAKQGWDKYGISLKYFIPGSLREDDFKCNSDIFSKSKIFKCKYWYTTSVRIF